MDVRRRMLEDWLAFRRQPPTATGLLRRFARKIAVAFGTLIAAIVAYAVIGDPYWTGGAIGFGLAMVLHLIQQIRVATLTWPVASEFLDWARIEQAARDAGIDAHPTDKGMVE